MEMNTTDIRLIHAEKKRFLALLLLADEQESMIDRYLERGDLFVWFEAPERPVAVAVVTCEKPGVHPFPLDALCRRRGALGRDGR